MTRQDVRIGFNIPVSGIPLADHRAVFDELVALGCSDLWSSEARELDAFSPLLVAAACRPQPRLGTGVVPVFTRGALVLAQHAAALAEAAPDQAVVGIGASSPVVVRDWNGVEFSEPYRRVRDTLRFLREILSGERVTREYDTFQVERARLARPPATVPGLMIGAKQQGMLRLAAREADGAVVNWVSASDSEKIARLLADEAGAARRERLPELVARLFVWPSTDDAHVRAVVRPMVAEYLTPPGYREYQHWMGRGRALARTFELWDSGRRSEAVEAIPDEVVDELVIHGSIDECRRQIAAHLTGGVTTVVLTMLPLGPTEIEGIRELDPRAVCELARGKTS